MMALPAMTGGLRVICEQVPNVGPLANPQKSWHFSLALWRLSCVRPRSRLVETRGAEYPVCPVSSVMASAALRTAGEPHRRRVVVGACCSSVLAHVQHYILGLAQSGTIVC